MAGSTATTRRATQDADEIGVQDQDGERDHRGDQAGRHEEADGVDVHGAERADLLVDAHRAEPGGDLTTRCGPRGGVPSSPAPISFVIASPTMGPSTVLADVAQLVRPTGRTRTMPTKSDRVAAIGSVSALTRRAAGRCVRGRWPGIDLADGGGAELHALTGELQAGQEGRRRRGS